jgi:NADP-dependent 3-hydroxy acid dehydrogenase YdfG
MASFRELTGRIAVVTGGTSGIGRATAEVMVQAGARVIIAARTAAAVQETASVLGCEGVAADASEEDGVARLRAVAPDADLIVHAAGAFELAPLHEMEIAAFDRIVAVNLRAAFLLVHAFLPSLLARGAGDIVLIGSIAGRQAFPANGAYSASKFGLRGMHAVLQAELRGTGVRASLIEPAATDTPLWDAIDRERNTGLPPRDAMLTARVVAEAVLFAASQPRGTVTPNILLERA